MRIIKGKIAVLLFISILAPYMGISQINESADGISRVKAETISDETEWNIKYMNAEESYEESQNLKKIRVAVLDSGLDYDEDIPFVERKDFLGEEELHPIYQDYTGHGTSVAGLICAKKSDDRITGIAANVDLYAGRILDAENKAPVDRVIEGIEWAIEKKVNIIHMSYGTQEYSEELEEAINKAYNQGILLIAAAGNSGTAAEDESTVEYPAAFDNVISVGATNVENKKTEISSSGSELDVVAPGDQILSSGAFGGVVVEEGTSVSAAQVTGLAAVLWGKHPDKSNEFIKGLLVSGANAEAVDENCGNGIVDYEQSKQNYEKMNKVYCGFKKEGVSEKAAVKKAEESVGENTKTICEEDDVNYVNGLWSGETHAGFVTKGSNINIMKAGAVAPDHIKVMKGFGDHPYFHGGGNYIANTQYIYAVAKLYINAKKDTKNIDLPIYETVFTNGKNPFSDVEINGVEVKHSYETKEEKENRRKKNVRRQLKVSMQEFFKQCLAEDKNDGIQIRSNKEKGYALLGAAIHNITDAFSHRACLNVGEMYGGWRQVVHDPSSVDSAKEDVCAAAKWKEWSKSKALGPIKEMYNIWKNTLICADDVKKLSVSTYISAQITTKLITAMEEDKEDYYTGFEQILKLYNNSISNIHVRINKLNSYWEEIHTTKGQFALNTDVKNYKLLKPKKSDIDIRLTTNKKEIQVSINGVTQNTLCEVSGKGVKGKRIEFTKKDKYVKKGKNYKTIPCWTITNSKLTSDKIKIEIYSISQKYSIVKQKNYTVKFSNKGLLNKNGKIKNITVKSPKKMVLNLGQKGKIKKLSKYKNKYKMKEWYAIIDGHKNTIGKKASFQSYIAGELVLYPVFVKK